MVKRPVRPNPASDAVPFHPLWSNPMAHSFTNLLYHVVFATKERRPLLDLPIRSEVCGLMGGILAQEGGILLEGKAMDEHVHLLMKLPPDLAVSRAVQAIKARSSFWIHKTRPADRAAFAWQVGYGAFTVSESQVEHVRKYIRNQEEHHRRRPYTIEMRSLLVAHGFEADETAYWE